MPLVFSTRSAPDARLDVMFLRKSAAWPKLLELVSACSFGLALGRLANAAGLAKRLNKSVAGTKP